jgi:hypothetical protein
MSDVIVAPAVVVPAMSNAAIENVRALEDEVLARPQVAIETEHILHGGMYYRTICIPAGVVITGALIKIATVLLIEGDVTIFMGDNELRVQGRHRIPAAAGRKVGYYAHADTELTMIFPTKARTVEEAEREFTDEADRLWSRHGINHTLITGV